MTILLFTQSHPYGAASEHIFIEPEIRHLVEQWGRVILVPRLRKGNRLALPPGAEVADDYAEFLQRHLRLPQMIRSALGSRSFFHELAPAAIASVLSIEDSEIASVLRQVGSHQAMGQRFSRADLDSSRVFVQYGSQAERACQ